MVDLEVKVEEESSLLPNLSLFSGEVTSRSIVSSRDSSLIWPSSLTRRVLFPRILARAPVISFSTLSRLATMGSTSVKSISLGDTNLFPTKMTFLCFLGNLHKNWITISKKGIFPVMLEKICISYGLVELK